MAKKEKTNRNGIATLAVEPEAGDRTITFATADTYVPHNIEVVIPATDSEVVLLQSKTVDPSTQQQTIEPDVGYGGLSRVIFNPMPTGTAGTPIATKGNVTNHSITVTPSVENSTGYIEGGVKTGTHATVTAAELVSGSQTISINTTTDVTNLKEVVTDVNPIVYVKDVTVATDATREISFTGLPSEPIAWTLDCATYITSIDNQYRCISARKDNTGTYTYTIYKRNGNNTPYVYYQTQGFTQTYNNGTLTLTATTAGNAEYCGSFFNKTYRLMAVCKNDGRNEIFI